VDQAQQNAHHDRAFDQKVKKESRSITYIVSVVAVREKKLNKIISKKKLEP
jgi:hypothetical protein